VEIIQQKLLELTRDSMSDLFANALVNVNGQLKTYPIYKTTLDGNKIVKYIYLDDVQAQGQILSATLVDNQGNALAVKHMNIIKGDSGLLIAFQFVLKVEANAG
jgi:hypothetical protein